MNAKIPLLVLLFSLIGCSVPSSKLQKIELGMSKSDVSQRLGKPRVVRGSMKNAEGNVIDVWEYRLSLPEDDSAGETIGKTMMTVFTLGAAAMEFAAPQRDYWLYFCNGELVQWGQAGDWQVERDRLYSIRFTERANLVQSP